MIVTLSQSQRILVAIIYLLLLVILFQNIGVGIGTAILDTSVDYSIWFYSGALLIILGKYVAQPYFTKPTDAITNSSATIIALVSLSTKDDFLLYNYAVAYSILILVTSLVSIGLKDKEHVYLKRIGQITYSIASKLGDSQVIFSIVYLLAAISYFALNEEPNLIALVLIFTFWICITFFDIIGKIVVTISLLFRISTKHISLELGKAIACENPLLYKVEISSEKSQKINTTLGNLISIQTEETSKSVGIIININQLLDKKWLSVYLLQNSSENKIQISTSYRNSLFDKNSILSTKNFAYKIDSLELLAHRTKAEIEMSELYINRERFVGYVDQGSNINSIKFHLLSQKENLEEGDILEAMIYGKKAIYQVIDGLTREEILDNRDLYGYTSGVARKLGSYNEGSKELNVVKWMPEIYSKLFIYKTEQIDEDGLKAMAKNSIGRLPGTAYEIPINDINALITHNTAILGILGIGKSRLTFELIQKSLNEINELKVICIDLTNEYKQEDKIPSYVSADSIKSDKPDAFNQINANYDYIETIGEGNYAKQIPDKSGNLEDYRQALKTDLVDFLFGTEEIPNEYTISNDNRIRIYNPDYHKVSKGEKMGIHVLTPALSPAEKTRIICEEVLKILMKFPPVNDNSQAKVLIVFEEAHSLVPEWNSIANEGDKTAVNGTAKVILQGRKYGFGSFVITQRTANISKSILNQCNTVFALRVFDDTGKQFLENYIGSDYANTLPTLEERHAIAVGKALKLKQPVIIQLNHMKYLTLDKEAN